MDNRLLRTFVAVTVPTALLDVRNMLRTTVQHKKDNLKWVQNGQIHLTLKFIGYTPPDGISAIHDTLANVSKKHSAMGFEIATTGCFPVSTRPRILWVGLQGDEEPLVQLVRDINNALDPFGYPADEKQFIPHITLARIKYPPKQTPDITQYLHAQFEPIPFFVNKFILMSSELRTTGAVYSSIHEYNLLNQV